MTLTRRRVRVSKYIILVNRIGTKMGTYFIIINIIVIKQLLKSSKWRTDRDSNPGDGLPPTHFPGVRLRPLGHLSIGRGL